VLRERDHAALIAPCNTLVIIALRKIYPCPQESLLMQIILMFLVKIRLTSAAISTVEAANLCGRTHRGPAHSQRRFSGSRIAAIRSSAVSKSAIFSPAMRCHRLEG
jgi:hypothetical protein